MTDHDICWCSHTLTRHHQDGHRKCAVPGCGCNHYRERIITPTR